MSFVGRSVARHIRSLTRVFVSVYFDTKLQLILWAVHVKIWRYCLGVNFVACLTFSRNRQLRSLPPELGNLSECYQLGLEDLHLSGIPKYVRSGWLVDTIFSIMHVQFESFRRLLWTIDNLSYNTLEIFPYSSKLHKSSMTTKWPPSFRSIWKDASHSTGLSYKTTVWSHSGLQSKDVLTYLRAKQRKAVPYYRMKLMVIGLQVTLCVAVK